ncbi:amidase [Novosphingobium sp.]|uniref:amidase n=1 Tax=Novosphingobium sp. TaxID=1874826 RepID=UPI00286B07C5|nr:amidase [Novosphingobium sp.]
MRRLLPFLILALVFSQGAEAKTRKPSKAEMAATEAKARLDAETAAVRSAAAAQVQAIQSLDDDPKGPQLDAVIVYNPNAAYEAALLAHTGRLQGKTVLIKDNVETRDFPTTAGSLALANNSTGRDAPLVIRIRADGGVILGKTNLSEWANIRSPMSSSGWSGVGGQTRNPYATDRSACGSSSGSGAAVAAGMAWGAVGTETDGSITCPASVGGIVGFKPTVGLISRTGIVPISHSQDTPGPMTMTVPDAALLLTVLAGSDARDPATREADARRSDYTLGIGSSSLRGVRIGVLTRQSGNHPGVNRVFDQAKQDLLAAGAILVPIDYDPPGEMFRDEGVVLYFELREDLNLYLGGLPGNPGVRTLSEVIMFNKNNALTELRWFGQETFVKADKPVDRVTYEKARANSLRLAGPEGVDKLLRDNRVAVLIAPTSGPAWPIDLVTGDHFIDVGAGSLAAIAGYPHLTVPMGQVEGLPVGISFIGPKWADKLVLDVGAAYERARTAPLPRPGFKHWGE